jgi:hypothetical protein
MENMEDDLKNNADNGPNIDHVVYAGDYLNRNYDIFSRNYENFFLELSDRDPDDISLKSGSIILKDKKLLLSFFEQGLLVDLKQRAIFILPAGLYSTQMECLKKLKDEEISAKYPLMPDKFSASIILHYLLNADGFPLSGQWINYRELPGGMFYADTIPGVLKPLSQKYESSGAGFVNKIIDSGGHKNGSFKFAGEICPFQKFPILFVMEEKDEEFDSEIRALFDKSASHYLKSDIIKTLLVYTVKKLIGA